MKTPIKDYLSEIVESVRPDESGEVADYIPTLAQANPDRLALAMTTVSGRTYTAGDTDAEFTIQSMSKPFAYAAAITEHGTDKIDSIVGTEPSGEAFNELSLEQGTHRPKNPMINVGALAINQFVCQPGANWKTRTKHMVELLSTLAGRKLRVDYDAYECEMDTAHRNMSIAHMLAAYGFIETTPHDAVRGYTAQCSVLVNTRDVAMMTAVLANGGVNPVTNQTVLGRSVVRRVLSVMAIAGMYDEAGEWFTDVGIPAKSGVAGGLLGALPGQAGLAAFSPRLNDHGNSVRSIAIFRKLSEDLGLHLMDADAIGSRALRGTRVSNGRSIIEIQGPVNFTAAEIILNRLATSTPSESEVVFDVSRVGIVNPVGRTLILEAMRRLSHDGKEILFYDPEGVLPNPDMGEGLLPVILQDAP